VVIDVERPVKYASSLLKRDPSQRKPRRLYVDLKMARVSSEIESSIPIKGGLLERARAGQFTKDKVRVVLDINSIDAHKIFHLYDPFRIVVDVRGTERRDVKSAKASVKSKRRVRKGIKRSGTWGQRSRDLS
jgi:N-acetylmuramoyl-L-alanine amidase